MKSISPSTCRKRSWPPACGLADIVQMNAEFSGAPGIQFPVQIRGIRRRPIRHPNVHHSCGHESAAEPDVTAGHDLPGHPDLPPGEHIGRAPILVPISAVMQDASGDEIAWVVGADQTVSRRK